VLEGVDPIRVCVAYKVDGKIVKDFPATRREQQIAEPVYKNLPGPRTPGQEFGATTGRRRRCGWFDALVVRHAFRINGIKRFALTKLDVLDGVDPIRICVGYKAGGKTLRDFPTSRVLQAKAQPIYKNVRGFTGDLRQYKTFEQFPDEAKRYVKELERAVQAKCALVSMGKSREETLVLEKDFSWLK
jgi:adenylosuccinate synthase